MKNQARKQWKNYHNTLLKKCIRDASSITEGCKLASKQLNGRTESACLKQYYRLQNPELYQNKQKSVEIVEKQPKPRVNNTVNSSLKFEFSIISRKIVGDKLVIEVQN